MNRIHPQNQRSKRTRAAVLDATWSLLEEEGPARTTMAAVAARAGVSRRALYLHFASRADLLLALHAHVDERLDLDASLAPVRDAEDSVAALDAFAAHLAGFHSRTLRVDLAVQQAKDDDADAAALIDQAVAAWYGACLELTGRLDDEGRLAVPWRPDTAADLLWTLMFPDNLERLLNGRGWTVEQYGELLATLLRRTLVVEVPPD